MNKKCHHLEIEGTGTYHCKMIEINSNIISREVRTNYYSVFDNCVWICVMLLRAVLKK